MIKIKYLIIIALLFLNLFPLKVKAEAPVNLEIKQENLIRRLSIKKYF